MHERPLSESEEITYHATDLPAPITVGAMLWVAIGFFPLPLALLIHWLMHRMPEWARWLRSLAAYDGAALVAVLLTATVGFGLALLALRQTSDPPLMARLQSCVDSAGLESWQLLLFLTALPIVLILAIVRAAGALELGLLTAIALSVLTARRIKRYPRPAVNLVPAELAAEVEPLRKQQGHPVAYQWSFTPTPESAPELLSLTVAFSPTRLEEARERPRERQSEGDWLRYLQADLMTPEIVALAAELHDLHEKKGWTPFQRCRNLLALLESFQADATGASPRFAIETLYEQQASPADLAVAAYTLLRALRETVPQAALVLRNDNSEAGIGIAGAEEFPDSFRGFFHEGTAYLFVKPELTRDHRGLRWVWRPIPEDWGAIRVIRT